MPARSEQRRVGHVDLELIGNDGLDLGDGIAILNDPEELLARVTQTAAARSEEDVEAGEEEVSSSEPEVLKKGMEDNARENPSQLTMPRMKR